VSFFASSPASLELIASIYSIWPFSSPATGNTSVNFALLSKPDERDFKDTADTDLDLFTVFKGSFSSTTGTDSTKTLDGVEVELESVEVEVDGLIGLINPDFTCPLSPFLFLHILHPSFSEITINFSPKQTYYLN
jgi:hypothetical protein